MSVIHVTKQTYPQQVEQAEEPVLLDFWASWCGPCRMIAPILEEIAAEHPHLTVAKINVDEEPELTLSFGINSIPTLILMEKGEIVEKTVGYIPKEELLELLGL